MIAFGYGKILHVNLSTGTIEKKEIDPEFARKYAGGMGFSLRILYDRVGPDIDPLSEDNLLIVAAGALTGTQAPFASRTEITTRDPLTGSIGSGNTGGMLGPALKHAGFEAIVIGGRAGKPVYLAIDNGSVAIRDADHLWGRDSYETTDILKKESAKASVLAIGVAGENMVRYACPVTDYYHFAARAGAGAVMGSKRLKAITVRGTGVVKIAKPGEFQAVVKEIQERIASRRPDLEGHIEMDTVRVGSLPARNFQTGFIPQFMETRGWYAGKKYFTGKLGTCYACPVQCIRQVEVKEGKYAGLKFAPSLRPGMTFAWGATCGINNPPAIWKCMELCSRFGLDYCSSSNSIAFAMELFQRGLITKKDTDGLDLSWGNEDTVLELLSRIALRKGFGDVLADGVVAAAARIGKGAEKYAMAVKGREIAFQEPRSCSRGFAFGFLTNPRGGDNIKSTHFEADVYSPDWWIDKFDIFEDLKERMYCVPPAATSSSWEGKPLMSKWFEELFSVLNALGICLFPAAMYLAVGPTYLARLYSSLTGWDTTPREMMKLGERVFTLLKAYTVRQGLSRKDDRLPDRFYTEPLPEGPSKGAVFSREGTDKLLDEYYDLRSWDRESGLPTKEKLAELGLADVAEDLRARGRLTVSGGKA